MKYIFLKLSTESQERLIKHQPKFMFISFISLVVAVLSLFWGVFEVLNEVLKGEGVQLSATVAVSFFTVLSIITNSMGKLLYAASATRASQNFTTEE